MHRDDQVAYPENPAHPSHVDIDGNLAKHKRQLAAATSPPPSYKEDRAGRSAKNDRPLMPRGEGEQGHPRGPPAAQIMPLPPYLTVKRTIEFTGNCRAKIYQKIAAGRYRAVKDGAKTLVETQSVLDDIASLPPAQIGPRKATPQPHSRDAAIAKATKVRLAKRSSVNAEAS
jgi:hypothetical protein